MKRFFRSVLFHRILFSLVILVVCLVVLELAVRIGGVDTYYQNRLFVLNRALDYPDVFEKDYDLFWRFRKDRVVTSKFFEGKTYHINSLGLRGDEISEVKNKKRILFLGNSCTFGWGVSLSDTYAVKLGELLNDEYEIINGAIPGYSSLQGRRFFENQLVGLKPDIVFIQYAWNDHWSAAMEIADKDQRFSSPAILELQNFLSRFHTYRLMKKLLVTARNRSPDSLFNRDKPVYRVSLDDFYLNLKAICGGAQKAGCRPILLTSPIPSLETYYPTGVKSNMHLFHERYNRVIRQLAVDEQIEMIDLALEFDSFDDLFDDAVNDPIHFNARGHRKTAELITAYLKP